MLCSGESCKQGRRGKPKPHNLCQRNTSRSSLDSHHTNTPLSTTAARPARLGPSLTMPLACACNPAALEDGGDDTATLPFDVIPPVFTTSSLAMGTAKDSPRRTIGVGARSETKDTPNKSTRSRRRQETVTDIRAEAETEPASITTAPRSRDTPTRSTDSTSSPMTHKHLMPTSPDSSHNHCQAPLPNRRPRPPSSGSELSDDLLQRLVARRLSRLPGVRHALGHATKGLAKQKLHRAFARGKAKLKRAFNRAGDDKSSGAGSRTARSRKAKRRASKTYSSSSGGRAEYRAAKWVQSQSYRSSHQVRPGSEGYSFQLSSPPSGDEGGHHCGDHSEDHTGNRTVDSSLNGLGSPSLDFSAAEAQSTPRRGRVRPPSITESLAQEESEELSRQSGRILGILHELRESPAKETGRPCTWYSADAQDRAVAADHPCVRARKRQLPRPARTTKVSRLAVTGTS